MGQEIEPGKTNGTSSVQAPPSDGISSKQLTEEQLLRRREKRNLLFEQESVVLVGSGLIVYLVVGDVWTAWKLSGSLTSALWAFFKSYFGLALSAGIILGILSVFIDGAVEAVRAWGGYVLALVLGPLALWYWAGSYNWWRDIVIAIFVMLVLFYARRPFHGLISRSLAGLESWSRDPKPPAWLKRLEQWEQRLATPRPAGVDEDAESAKQHQAPTENKGADELARLRAFLSRPRARQLSLVLTWLLTTWVLASAADRLFGPRWTTVSEPLPVTPGRFAEIASKHAATWSAAEPRRLGVALSGGGFRAALMHAGVLAALEERGIPIASLATVSGGSIIGGFYVVGGSPADFRDAVAAGRFNLKRELIDFPNLIRLPCPGHIPIVDLNLLWWCSFSRVDVQANLLDRVLFDGKLVTHLRADRKRDTKDTQDTQWWSKPPWWVIGATDLRHGQGVGLSADGIFRRAHATPWRGLQKPEIEADLQRVPSEADFEDLTAHKTFGEKRIAELIAVSGAFPGAFGSTVFSIRDDSSLQIVDGGITDNLGYSLLMSALEKAPINPRGKEWLQEMVLLSDGGMPLSAEKDVAGYTEFFRAMDVVYASSGIMVKPNSLCKVWLSPRTIVAEKLTEDDRARLPKALRDKVPTLKEFQDDFRKAQAVFLDTSTLKDRFEEGWIDSIYRRFWNKRKSPGGKAAVDALFTLGQYLVYINLPDISDGLRPRKEKEKKTCQIVEPVSSR